MRALDELAETGTDSARVSATTGAPIIGLAGARAEVDRATGCPMPLAVEPGTVSHTRGSSQGYAPYNQPLWRPGRLSAGERPKMRERSGRADRRPCRVSTTVARFRSRLDRTRRAGGERKGSADAFGRHRQGITHQHTACALIRQNKTWRHAATPRVMSASVLVMRRSRVEPQR